MSLWSGKNPDRGGSAPADAPTGAGSERPPVPAPLDRATRERREPPKPAKAAGETAMTHIGKSISLQGELTGSEDVVVEGKVEGKVSLPNNLLTIGAGGSVRAEVNAKAVVVVGKVSGNVTGTERIEIQASGIVDGDVSAPKLVVAEGAVLNGSIAMTAKEGAGAGSARPSAPPAPARSDEAAKPPAQDVRKVG